MTERVDSAAPSEDASLSDEAETCFVAFCDILGFSDMVVSDFARTLRIYKRFGDLMADSPFSVSDVKVTMYSDSILIVGKTLETVLGAVQGLWFFALGSDFMIRGAITKGHYWERRQGNDMLVVSDALVRAVKLEKVVSVPAVVLADDIEIPDGLWLKQFTGNGNGIVATSLLHFRDRNIVNPFNSFWLLSAGNRATILMEMSPSHRDKYLWFLALHEAVTERRTLVPPAVFARLVRDGVIGWFPKPPSAEKQIDQA